jgi:N-acetylmuramoyl-L-alanine amidase
MQTRRPHTPKVSPVRYHALLIAGRVMLVIASAALLAAGLIGWRLYVAGQGGQSAAVAPAAGRGTASLSGTAPAAPDAPRVGVVAGHSGYDSGAVCPDGWTEADVNQIIAEEVQSLLERRGYQVDLMQEFDERLTGYRADALVSIHADSCDVPGATGFKVARVTDSRIPEAEDRLVACLYREYEAVTDMARHPGSITDDMTSYHAFREIDDHTPGAIIETGFMLDDRDTIIDRPKLAARGIASGVVCFVEGTMLEESQ